MEQHTRLFNSLVRQRTAKTLAELKQTMNLSWLATKDYRIINTWEQFEWALDHIRRAPMISVDTETSGLYIYNLSNDNPIKDHIVGMSISWERNQGIYIPFAHVMFDNLDKAKALTALRPYLESKSIITHNGLYDGKVFYDEGIRLNITQDTMLMYFNLDSTVSKGSKGLKAITTRRYGYEVIELSDIFEKESDAGLFMYVEYELVKAYACADSDHTLMIFLDSFKELLPGQLKSYRLDIRVQNELVRSEYMGKGIDMDLLHKLNDINTRDMAMIEDLIYRYVGIVLATRNGIENATSNRYRFNISSTQELAYILFDLLGYEIPEGLKGAEKLSVDKYTLRALTGIKTSDADEIFEYLIADKVTGKTVQSCIVEYDFPWASAKDSTLLDIADLRERKYKLAPLITKYRKLEKLRSSFFSPLLSNNFEGKYFSGIKMTRAETARLVDFIQTLDKYLKKLVVPLEHDKRKQYIMDFDFAQIEYRVMAGEAKVDEVIRKLQNSEADYHREGGSLILGKPAEDITGDERSNLKSINFGIPYGMSKYGILQNRYGIGLEETKREEKLAEIVSMLNAWDKGLHPIKVMLDNYRTKAVTPVSDATLPSHLKGKSMGRISNVLGRTRMFNLSNLTKQSISSIKRQAGNYPIQSFAREIFCQAFCDFCQACRDNGLMDVRVPDPTRATGFRFDNKVNIMAYIHDECLMSVDGDVNHEFLYKLIYKHCMIQLENYPRFYCGINVIDNWYEGKDDKFEAPVGYVEEVIARNPQPFCDINTNHKQQALDGITDYMIRRITKELVQIDPQVQYGYFDLQLLVPKFKNYFVKPKIAVYIGLHRKPDKDAAFDDFAVVSIESYALKMFPVSYIKGLDGVVRMFVRDGDIYTPKVPFQSQEIVKESVEFREWKSNVEEQLDTNIEDSDEAWSDITIAPETVSKLEELYSQPKTISWSFKEE